MAELPVSREYPIFRHHRAASQMAVFMCNGAVVQRFRPIPITRVVVMVEARPFMLPRYGSIGVDIGAILDLLPRDSNRNKLLRPARRICRRRRNQYLSTRQPGPCIDDKRANDPGLIIEIAVFYSTDRSVRGFYCAFEEIIRGTQPFSESSSPRILLSRWIYRRHCLKLPGDCRRTFIVVCP